MSCKPLKAIVACVLAVTFSIEVAEATDQQQTVTVTYTLQCPSLDKVPRSQALRIQVSLTGLTEHHVDEQSIPAQKAAILLPVQAWVHAFDTQQETFPSDAFTDDCVVIDEFAPFAWSAGTTSVRQWYAAVEGLDSPQNRRAVLRSKETVDVGKAENLAVSGDLAYMTFHATWSAVGKNQRAFVQHGLFTVVERKTANGWRMSANSWGILP